MVRGYYSYRVSRGLDNPTINHSLTEVNQSCFAILVPSAYSCERQFLRFSVTDNFSRLFLIKINYKTFFAQNMIFDNLDIFISTPGITRYKGKQIISYIISHYWTEPCVNITLAQDHTPSTVGNMQQVVVVLKLFLQIFP